MRLGYQRPPRTVLLLEDDPELSLATEMLLHSVGFSMRCERTAARAREALHQSFPDVVITDIGLVGEDGLTFLRWAKREARELKRDFFAIVISGQLDPGTGDAALAAGADRFYKKPFDPAALVSEVVAATGAPPLGPHLTEAFVNGTRISGVLHHLS